MKTINISPSDLAFLYLDSPWGFYQKYILGVKRPPLILPKIFTVIDTLMKCKFSDENFKSICSNYPDAVLKDADQWVKSKPIRNPKFPDIEIVLRGKIDGVLKYPDNTYSIIDFKTSSKQKKEANIKNYFMQCSAYAVMYEERTGIPVTQLVIMIAVDSDHPQVFIKKRDDYIKDFISYREAYDGVLYE
jgi:hypothetical protein